MSVLGQDKLHNQLHFCSRNSPLHHPWPPSVAKLACNFPEAAWLMLTVMFLDPGRKWLT